LQRREFIKTGSFCVAEIGLGVPALREKTHVVTLSFDDGFKKSFELTASIYEKFGDP
jgi:hypothetical protein